MPPDIVYGEETSKDLSVSEGENVTLNCQATGKPKPRVTWKREDGQHILIRNSTSFSSSYSSYPLSMYEFHGKVLLCLDHTLFPSFSLSQIPDFQTSISLISPRSPRVYSTTWHPRSLPLENPQRQRLVIFGFQHRIKSHQPGSPFYELSRCLEFFLLPVRLEYIHRTTTGGRKNTLPVGRIPVVTGEMDHHAVHNFAPA